MVYVCIDLGCMNTSIAVENKGEPELIKFGTNETFPTVIYKGGETRIGSDVGNIQETDPSYLFSNLKSLIGRTFMEDDVTYLQSYLPYTVVDGENHRCMVVACENGQEVVEDPTIFLSYYIRCLIDIVKSTAVNTCIEGLILSYPPSFTDLQKDQLQKAANYTGISHIELVSDTIAACMYSGVKNGNDDVNALVVNCGASTFNVSVIHCNKLSYDVIGTEGLNNVGGNTFTNMLLLMAIEQMAPHIKYSDLSTKDQQQLRELVEEAKIKLSTSDSETIRFHNKNIVLSRNQFEENCSGLVQLCCDTVTTVISEVNEHKPDVLVFSGRGCKLPLLREAIVKTANIPVIDNVDNSVALGLAFYSMTNQFKRGHNHESCNPFLRNILTDYGTMANPATPIIEDYDFSNYDENYVDDSHYPSPTPTPLITHPEPQALYSTFVTHTKKYKRPAPVPEPDSDIIIDSIPISKYISTPASKPNPTPDSKSTAIRPSAPSRTVLQQMSSVSITDRGMYNIGIRFYPPRINGDIDLLYKKNDPLDRTVEKEYVTNPNKPFKIVLFQGKTLWHQECTPIRIWEMAFDDNHPKSKKNKFIMNITMKSDGAVQLVLRWKDDDSVIRILSNEDLTMENQNVASRVRDMNCQNPSRRLEQPLLDFHVCLTE